MLLAKILEMDRKWHMSGLTKTQRCMIPMVKHDLLVTKYV